MGCLVVRLKVAWFEDGFDAYQIAHNDLALAPGRTSLGRGSLGASVADWLGGLLDATGRGNRSRSASGRASLDATAAGRSAALGGGDLIERLVKLAGHDGGCEG